jgi:hypothetical protein
MKNQIHQPIKHRPSISGYNGKQKHFQSVFQAWVYDKTKSVHCGGKNDIFFKFFGVAMNKELSDYINKKIKELGLSNKQFIEKVQISKSGFYKILDETNAVPSKLSTFISLASALTIGKWFRG